MVDGGPEKWGVRRKERAAEGGMGRRAVGYGRASRCMTAAASWVSVCCALVACLLLVAYAITEVPDTSASTLTRPFEGLPGATAGPVARRRPPQAERPEMPRGRRSSRGSSAVVGWLVARFHACGRTAPGAVCCPVCFGAGSCWLTPLRSVPSCASFPPHPTGGWGVFEDRDAPPADPRRQAYATPLLLACRVGPLAGTIGLTPPSRGSTIWARYMYRCAEGACMARGRRTALTIHLTPEERQTLMAWQRSTAISAGRARRGRILLLLADGVPVSHVATMVGLSRRFVYKWVRRF